MSVTGSITGADGVKDVRLDNAATEATLKLLLDAVKAQGGLGAAQQVAGIAGKAGIDSNVINSATAATTENTVAVQQDTKAANEWADGVKKSANITIDRFGILNQTILGLMNGTQQASNVVNLLSTQLPGAIGEVVAGMGKLIAMQEESFAAYQQISAAGINFSGSLTNMRLAAANSYLTLNEFTNLMKNNSEAFAKMGGTADQGAIAFSKVSKELMQSDAGEKLMALGYTTEQVNQGMATYIAVTGGRNAQEMKDTKALAASSAEYMAELDDLAQITGKSKDQQEQALKEATANQAYQSYLLTLDEEGRKKANTAMLEANAKGGKGAAEALQSQLLGLPPMTKAAQEFTAVAPRMAAANIKMADAVNDASKGVGDIKRAGGELGLAANQTKKDLGDTGKALIMQGGSFSNTIGAIFGTANRNAQQGVETMEDVEKQRAGLEAKRKERESSQADDMAKATAGFKKLGAELFDIFSPLLTVAGKLAMAIGTVAGFIGNLLSGFNSFLNSLGTFGEVIKGLVVAGLALAAIQKVAAAKNIAGSTTETLLERAKGILPGKAASTGGVAGRALPAAAGSPLGALGGVTTPPGGEGFIGFIKGLGRGLASLAPIAVPMLIGAGAVAGVIGILGAGVAAAIALVGLSLPTFAKGLSSLGELDGGNLIKVAAGIGALGISMVAFTAGSALSAVGSAFTAVANLFTGGGVVKQISNTVSALTPILPQLSALGPAINNYAQGIVAFGKAVNTVDIAKAEQLKKMMAGSPVADSIKAAGAQMIQAATNIALGTGTEKAKTAELDVKPSVRLSNEEKTHNELVALNTTMKDLLKYVKDTADNTKRTHDATKSLSGNLFA